MTMKVGRPDGAYVNQAPKTLLPCCASVRPHPDSAGFHQRSVRSIPQLVGALPKGKRWICLLRVTDPTVQVKVADPLPGANWNEAVPTFVLTTADGSNAPVHEGPVER